MKHKANPGQVYNMSRKPHRQAKDVPHYFRRDSMKKTKWIRQNLHREYEHWEKHDLAFNTRDRIVKPIY